MPRPSSKSASSNDAEIKASGPEANPKRLEDDPLLPSDLEPGEAELLRGWGEYLEHRYPNPDRIGCPTIEVLERLARERSLFQDRRTLDHVARCAPCSKQVRELSAGIAKQKT